jgi:hypothetical protein
MKAVEAALKVLLTQNRHYHSSTGLLV